MTERKLPVEWKQFTSDLVFELIAELSLNYLFIVVFQHVLCVWFINVDSIM